jgi:hypothetical protein
MDPNPDFRKPVDYFISAIRTSTALTTHLYKVFNESVFVSLSGT